MSTPESEHAHSHECAASDFSAGGGDLNCAQSVLAAFCERYGMDRATALSISAPFGGGLRCGEVCGAVSGGAMVVGLKYGRHDPQDADAKALCKDQTQAFTDLFRERCGALTCADLLGVATYTAEGHAAAQARGLYKEKCLGYVQTAAAILEELEY